MKRAYGLLAALLIAGTILTATADQAEARRGRHGGAIIGGLIGGLALSAALGSHRAYGYGYHPSYYYTDGCYGHYRPYYHRHNHYCRHRWHHW
jgi:hypothetical protein